MNFFHICALHLFTNCVLFRRSRNNYTHRRTDLGLKLFFGRGWSVLLAMYSIHAGACMPITTMAKRKKAAKKVAKKAKKAAPKKKSSRRRR